MLWPSRSSCEPRGQCRPAATHASPAASGQLRSAEPALQPARVYTARPGGGGRAIGAWWHQPGGPHAPADQQTSRAKRSPARWVGVGAVQVCAMCAEAPSNYGQRALCRRGQGGNASAPFAPHSGPTSQTRAGRKCSRPPPPTSPAAPVVLPSQVSVLGAVHRRRRGHTLADPPACCAAPSETAARGPVSPLGVEQYQHGAANLRSTLCCVKHTLNQLPQHDQAGARWCPVTHVQ